MADLKIDENNDIQIDANGDLIIISAKEAIAQSIKIALLTQYGESVYARNLGTPWVESIFIKNADFYQDSIEQILRNIVENVPGVISVTEFFFNEFDPDEGFMSISLQAQTIEGDVDFSEFVINNN